MLLFQIYTVSSNVRLSAVFCVYCISQSFSVFSVQFISLKYNVLLRLMIMIIMMYVMRMAEIERGPSFNHITVLLFILR